MAYLLDADVFIRAKNLHYGLDFCPAFWDWLIDRNAAGSVFSIEKVGDEVQAIEDDLAQWASDRGPGFFLPPGKDDLASLAAVSAWAGSHHYEPSAVSTFLQVADYYLVAQAHAGKHIVVTHEIPSASTRRRIKIPDACIGLGKQELLVGGAPELLSSRKPAVLEPQQVVRRGGKLRVEGHVRSGSGRQVSKSRPRSFQG